MVRLKFLVQSCLVIEGGLAVLYNCAISEDTHTRSHTSCGLASVALLVTKVLSLTCGVNSLYCSLILDTIVIIKVIQRQ